MAENFLGTEDQWKWIGRFAVIGFCVVVVGIPIAVIWLIVWLCQHLTWSW